MEYLENVDVSENEEIDYFVMPVQRVSRPNSSFRGFQGSICAGSVHNGDEITVLPSGEKAHVQQIIKAGKESDSAGIGDPVVVTLDREIDVSRGCVLVSDSTITDIHVSRMFTAQLLWMDDEPLYQGKNYLLRVGTRIIPSSVMKIKYKIDVNTGERVATTKIYKNEIAVCDIGASQNIVFSNFENLHALGSLILIDRVTNMTSGCGVIEHSLRRSDNLTWQQTDVSRDSRAERMNQKPVTIWFTGLSGSGKSTIANALEKRLFAEGHYTMLLDGDNVRMGLNSNLGFEPEDRIENIRRIAEVSKLMNDAGLIVLTAFISPFESDRQNARNIIGEDNFIEVYVNTPLEECERRDVKGLYKRAREKQIPNFTGITSPYEIPQNPEIIVRTDGMSVEECVNLIMKKLADL